MKLYIASTSGYSGKTLLALGLSRIWSGGGVSVGYVKPLGKIPVVEEGRIVDGDALFLAKEMGLPGPLEDVCPVVITQARGMATYRREPLHLRERVGRAVEKADSRVDILLLGGAANLSDGVFLGLSPLDIISPLDCRALPRRSRDGKRQRGSARGGSPRARGERRGFSRQDDRELLRRGHGRGKRSPGLPADSAQGGRNGGGARRHPARRAGDGHEVPRPDGGHPPERTDPGARRDGGGA